MSPLHSNGFIAEMRNNNKHPTYLHHFQVNSHESFLNVKYFLMRQPQCVGAEVQTEVTTSVVIVVAVAVVDFLIKNKTTTKKGYHLIKA